MLKNKLLAATGNSDEPLYSDSVFSTYTYTGNGSTQTINNGIDLAGKGGLVWLKSRNAAIAHLLFDTARSSVTGDPFLTTTSSQGQDGSNLNFLSYLSNGFNLESAGNGVNMLNQNTVAWTFRKAPKFFDVVTYTGDGTGSRSITHSLGVAPGMVINKSTDSVSNWFIYHRSLGNNHNLIFTTDAATVTPSGAWGTTDPTASTVTFGSGLNVNGVTYVAYLFAHDPSADGIIQCGSYVPNAYLATVSLGWEPQYILAKNTVGGDWLVYDNSRGLSATGGTPLLLRPNLLSAEVKNNDGIVVTATGFQTIAMNSTPNQAGTHIYMAIRRPNKPPTLGTQVYNAIARTGTGNAATVTGVGFAPDLMVLQDRGTTSYRGWIDRLRGKTKNLISSSTGGEIDYPNAINTFLMDGYKAEDTAYDASGVSYINHFFKRAPGFFDVVCYTGTGVARTVPHSLGVAPELMIVKNRSTTDAWAAYVAPLGATKYLDLSSTAGEAASSSLWSYTPPTANVFSVNVGFGVNRSGSNLVCYLFTTLPGISKVGSYTGNGTTQTINCGFTTGARFILIKRTDSTGDWYIWDTARGIVSANDPHLSLNSTAAEVTTDDSVDPDASGFIVNQVAATNINVSGGQYIFLSIA